MDRSRKDAGAGDKPIPTLSPSTKQPRWRATSTALALSTIEAVPALPARPSSPEWPAASQVDPPSKNWM
jgi:hypothetical protein